MVAFTYSMSKGNSLWCNCYYAKTRNPIPFPQPDREETLILGEFIKSTIIDEIELELSRVNYELVRIKI